MYGRMATACTQEVLNQWWLLLWAIWVQACLGPPSPRLSCQHLSSWKSLHDQLISGNLVPAPTLSAPKPCPSESHKAWSG